jgi:hypothetical protein
LPNLSVCVQACSVDIELPRAKRTKRKSRPRDPIARGTSRVDVYFSRGNCFRACARSNPGRKYRRARDFPGPKRLPEAACCKSFSTASLALHSFAESHIHQHVQGNMSHLSRQTMLQQMYHFIVASQTPQRRSLRSRTMASRHHSAPSPLRSAMPALPGSRFR